MRRFILLFFGSLIFFSCSDKNKIPNNVLPKSEMQDVMWDIIRADEFVTAYIWKNDSTVNRLNESTDLYEQIFSIHKITREKFQKSLSFYRDHPVLLKEIIDSLSQKENSFKERNPKKYSKDSSLLKKSILPIE